APLCRNRHFASLMADLPVFIRQSHAERDEAALAERIVKEEGSERAGRALGAAPLCRNRHFASLMADLPVFIRQSHAERDEAALAERIVKEEGSAWNL
ncbi:acyl-CoA dehydrogenase, partial [Caballeronia sp. M23-90]